MQLSQFSVSGSILIAMNASTDYCKCAVITDVQVVL